MSVYRRGTSKVYTIEFRHGGQLYKRASQSAERKAAEAEEREWRREIDAGLKHSRLPRMTIGQACVRYATEVLHPRRDRNLTISLRSAESRLQAITAAFGDREVSEIRTPEIADWRASLLKRALAPATVDRHLQDLRAVLRRAHLEWGTLTEVPRITMLGVRNSRLRWLTESEEADLLRECATDRNLWDTVVFALDTGARRGDVLQLERKDVRLDIRSVYFQHTKTDAPRWVPMTDRALAIVNRRLLMGAARLFPYDPNSGRQVGSRKGSRGRWKQGQATGFRQSWASALDRAKIKDFHFHDLRHTFASKLAIRGVSLYTIGELLGHRDPKMTKVYAHLQPQVMADAVSLLSVPRATVRDSQPTAVPGPSAATSPAHPDPLYS
jgi:integrase